MSQPTSSALPQPFIGVRMHENRTPTGRRTGTPAKHAALYFAYGRDKEARLEGEQRGEWLRPDGRIQSHDKVMAWAKQEALGHRYTFEAILSVPQGKLPPEAFCQAMRQGSAISNWRLMAHRDTKHRHTHVLFFRDKRLDKQTFLSWQTDVRAELARLEQQHPSAALRASLNDRAAQQERGLDADDLTKSSLAKRQGAGLGW